MTVQRMAALNKANEVRLSRAALRRRIYAGEVRVADVLFEPPAEVLSWSVAGLLRSQLRWGDGRVRKFLGSAGIRETRSVGALTVRERGLLASRLGGYTSS